MKRSGKAFLERGADAACRLVAVRDLQRAELDLSATMASELGRGRVWLDTLSETVKFFEKHGFALDGYHQSGFSGMELGKARWTPSGPRVVRVERRI